MKTISLRELPNKTEKLMRSIEAGGETTITDRGTVIATIIPARKPVKKKVTWANRKLQPEYAALLKAGKLKSDGDSRVYISEDRTSHDNSVARIED